MSVTTKVKELASYFPSMEKTYAKPSASWMDILEKLGPLKHMELVNRLRDSARGRLRLLHRLLSNGNNLEWLGHAFAPFYPAVYLATVLSSVALLGAVFFTAGTAVARAEPLALVVATLTLASPIVWDHHYGVMLPILALVFPTWLTARSERWGPLAQLSAAYLLIATNLSPLANATALGPMNFLQSYQFLGGIVLLTVLHRTCWLQQQETQIPFASLRRAVGG